MTQQKNEPLSPSIPPVPVGLEDLVGMAAASPDFARELVSRRGEAVSASGVELAPTEAAVLGAVGDATLARMIETCRAQQASGARRAFLAKASAAMLLLVGAGIATGSCEKKSSAPGNQTTTPTHKPDLPGKMPAPQMRPGMTTQPDASAPRTRPAPQVSAGARAPRPRPMRPSGVKTGISPGHRRRLKLDVETGSRPD